jgi:hypothetical protein
MSSPCVMAVFGHSGSHAPQLMHSSVIFRAMSLSSFFFAVGRRRRVMDGDAYPISRASSQAGQGEKRPENRTVPVNEPPGRPSAIRTDPVRVPVRPA